MFVGRQRELAELERRYQATGFQMVVLYGRRRVGKTRLIQEFCQNKPTLFHVGLQQSPEALLQTFSRDVLTQLPAKGSEFISRFQSWQDAFHYVAVNAHGRRLILVMDEYPYIAQAEPSVSSILQRAIDHEWKPTDLFVILCGSSMSFMERQILGYQSPLYGRRTAPLKIRPLPYWESLAFFQDWRWQEQLYGYGVCGGIPQYLEYFSAYEDFASAVKGELLALSGHLIEEPANLLKQEMREPGIYHSIIEAIAQGATRHHQIAHAIGKEARDITSYIKALVDLEIVEKKQPIEETNRKKTLYALADNLYRFWYRFIPSCLPLMSMGMEEVAWSENIAPELDAYFGRIFESMGRQFVQRAVKEGALQPVYQQYGSWWGNHPQKKRQEEIDVVAVNSEAILVGECKWRTEKTGQAVLESLQERGELIRHGRRISYILFSKAGFTEEVTSLAAEQGVRLVTAEEVR